MSKISHEKKVKMARKMMTTKERHGKHKQSIFNTLAWNLRSYFIAQREAKKRRIAEGNRNSKMVEREMAAETASISNGLEIDLTEALKVDVAVSTQ